MYDIKELGLTGSQYSYGTADGTYQYSSAWGLNSLGQATGDSGRYNSTGGNLGGDSWFFNGSTEQEIGLTGTNYSYAGSGGIFESSRPTQLNSAGEVIGFSERYSATGASLFEDAWLFNGVTTQKIGLSGSGYSYTTSVGTFEETQAQQLNDAGQALGRTDRWSASGVLLGADAWLTNGSNTQQIGLTGSGYSYTASGGIDEFSDALQLNSAGQAIGFSSRFNSTGVGLGEDAWLFNGSSTQQIGLSGSDYTAPTSDGNDQDSSPIALNDSGQVIGTTSREGPTAGGGADSWIYDGASTKQIGLTGVNYNYVTSGGVFEQSEPQQINKAGQVVGTSNRYSSSGANLGGDAWIYNGTTTRQIGLTGPTDSAATSQGTVEYNFPAQINDAGDVTGTTNRYGNAEIYAGGVDSWYYNGVSTIQIGLTGGIHSYTFGGMTVQTSEPLQLNKAGDVIGSSSRYDSVGNPLGQDGWFFDSATNSTIPLQFSVDSANDFSNTDPEFLTDSGVVLGSYSLYSGSTFVGSHVFYWSELYGFRDLGLLVNGGLNAEGWQSLVDVDATFAPPASGMTADGSPQFIIGDGLMAGNAAAGNSVYLLNAEAVPEPAFIGSLLIAPLLLRRTRTKVRAI